MNDEDLTPQAAEGRDDTDVPPIEKWTDAILKAIVPDATTNAAFCEMLGLLALACDSTRSIGTNGEAKSALRHAIWVLIECGHLVQLATLLAHAGASHDVLVGFPGVTPDAVAAASSLGIAIATGATADLSRIVEDVCLDGWRGIAPCLSPSDLEKADRATLMLIARRLLAKAADWKAT